MGNALMVVKKTAGTVGFFLKRHAPTILTVGGTVATVAGTVMACKSTLKVDEVLKAREDEKAKIEQAHEAGLEGYSEKDYKKDLVICKTNTAKDLIKLYWPSVTLTLAGVAGILSGHGMMQKRNAALAAAYVAVDGAFKDYRNRVRSALGDAKEHEFRFPLVEKEEVVDKVNPDTGEVEQETQKTTIVDPNSHSVYARFFDARNKNWRDDHEDNLVFLKQRQNWCSDRLRSRGYLFLNEVYEELGIPASKEGAVVGWIYSGDGRYGDNFVDFGIFDPKNGSAREFVNGYEDAVLLDFNVDGYILDRLAAAQSYHYAHGWESNYPIRSRGEAMVWDELMKRK